MKNNASTNTMPKEYREWIPVGERLPDQEGVYDTLVKCLLDDEVVAQAQRYTLQAHPAINPWQYGRTTHWRLK